MSLRRRRTVAKKCNSFGLTCLLGTAGVGELRAFDPSRRYVAHGPVERLTGLWRVPELQSPEALMRIWRDHSVGAWPSAAMPSARSFQAFPEQLPAVFNSGFTLYFRSVERCVPALAPLARQLETDLCLPPGCITCEAFASNAGTGAKMHLDPNMTFNVQMLGRKTWRVADNYQVTRPHTGFAVGEAPSPELLRYAHAPLPSAMPADAITFETAPGSVVYVPHGQWHATEASDMSFAVLFTVTHDPWVSLVTKALAERLRDSEAWREIPIGLRSPRFWSDHGAAVSALLDDLKRTVSGTTADDLKSWLGGPSAVRYRVRKGISLQVSSAGSSESQRSTLVLTQNGKSARREVPRHLATVFEWIASRPAGFTGDSAVRSLRRVDPDIILRTIAELHVRGILQVHGDRGAAR